MNNKTTLPKETNSEFDKIRELGKQYNTDPELIEDMIKKLDKVYQAQNELERASKDDTISWKFNNPDRRLKD